MAPDSLQFYVVRLFTVSVDLQPVGVEVAGHLNATSAAHKHFRFVAKKSRQSVDANVDERGPRDELVQRTCGSDETQNGDAAQQTRLETVHTQTRLAEVTE